MLEVEIRRMRFRASFLKNAGRFAEAHEIRLNLDTLYGRTGGPASVQARNLNTLASLALSLESHEEAEWAACKCLALCTPQPGDVSDESLATYRMMLAAILAERGTFDEAVSIAEEALSHFRRVHGPQSGFVVDWEREVDCMRNRIVRRYVDRQDRPSLPPPGAGMTSSNLPSYLATLEDYARKADALFETWRSADEAAAWRFKWRHPDFRGRPLAEVRTAPLERADARLVIAREQEFGAWDALFEFVETVGRDANVRRFEAAVEAVVTGDLESLRSMLRDDPELIRRRSTRRHRATLLHYIAANGVEEVRQTTPPNAVGVAHTLLAAGAEVDALAEAYGTRCTTMSLLVSSCHPAEAGLQTALAEMLADAGATLVATDSESQSPILTALAFGYLDTARALARRVSPPDDLAVAAGLGLIEEAARLLQDAAPLRRQIALALAAQHGHAEVVRLLLDAGEDPNRFNPEGFHAHSTPLHQAALSGHEEVVRLLVECGARLDIRDTLYQGTPLGWAVHGGQSAIAEFLRSRGEGKTSTD